MTNSVEHISEQIFKIIKGYGNKVVLFTDDGKKIIEPSDARRFYIPNLKIMINYENNETANELIINLSAGTDITPIRPMLNALRTMATRFLIEYTVKTYGKTITPKDFSFMAKQKVKESTGKSSQRKSEALKKAGYFYSGDKNEDGWREYSNVDGSAYWIGYQEGWKNTNGESGSNNDDSLIISLQSKLNEGFSGWHGTARKSVNELGDARIVVRHKRTIDEEKRGARTRQIESIFIENADGERFKFPNRNITAAKAMLKHVNEGGTPHDNFGQYIYSIMEEISQLKKFQKYSRSKNIFESEQEINEEITNRANNLRETLKQMSGQRGYKIHFEKFNKSSDISYTQEQINEFRNAITLQYFDEDIADSLPYVAKIIEGFRSRQDKEKEILDFARMVMQRKDNIALNRSIDMNDPSSPSTRRFRDPAAGVSAWVNYMAPYLADDELVNKMMQISDTVFEVSPKHVNLAQQAINVIKQNAKVVESIKTLKHTVYESQIKRINNTLNEVSDVKKIFSM